MKQISFLALFVLALFLGCSGNVPVSGKVTFSDGDPLTKGTVIFQNDATMARGTIQSDGTYKMGSLKESDGVPAGKYTVYVSDAHDYVSDGKDASVAVELIDSKMTNPDTSGLTFNTADKKNTFDITVERP